MECNKDKASRAKKIAEKKFAAKDFGGAKRFALIAQNLYPMLEGIAQMIATLEVYVAAENKADGEADRYAILGVTPQADDEMVRKQYRKLAVILHPDKNKSVGAEGAFKFISEAWSMLSDKTRRLIYDQKRNAKVPQKMSTPAGTSSAAPNNGFYNFTTPKVNVKTHKSTHKTSNSSSQVPSYKAKPNTFWTLCHRCKMQYEYLRVYLNHKVLCLNCREPFVATDAPPPTTPPPTTSGSKPSPWNFSQQACPPNARTDGSNGQTTFQCGPFSRTGGASSAAHAASVVPQAHEKVKRELEEAQAATTREEALKRKNSATESSRGQPNAAKRKKGSEDVTQSSHRGKFVFKFCTGSEGAGQYNASDPTPNNNDSFRANGITMPYGTKDAFQVDIQPLLLRKAVSDIQNQQNEWKLTSVGKSSLNDGVVAKPDTPDLKKQSESLNKATEAQDKRSSSDVSGPKEAEALEDLSINVPDPDFHDFDKDRTERCFAENQIWAAYDVDDDEAHDILPETPFCKSVQTAKTLLEMSFAEAHSPEKTPGSPQVDSSTPHLVEVVSRDTIDVPEPSSTILPSLVVPTVDSLTPTFHPSEVRPGTSLTRTLSGSLDGAQFPLPSNRDSIVPPPSSRDPPQILPLPLVSTFVERLKELLNPEADLKQFMSLFLNKDIWRMISTLRLQTCIPSQMCMYLHMLSDCWQHADSECGQDYRSGFSDELQFLPPCSQISNQGEKERCQQSLELVEEKIHVLERQLLEARQEADNLKASLRNLAMEEQIAERRERLRQINNVSFYTKSFCKDALEKLLEWCSNPQLETSFVETLN